ncbi:MAG: hypothetical protein IT429_10870 [Gemmataceae bacterium]|nr:hypothetical protein [Gemmataceae bacterium]
MTAEQLARVIAEALRGGSACTPAPIVLNTGTSQGGSVVVRAGGREFLVQVREITRKESAA